MAEIPIFNALHRHEKNIRVLALSVDFDLSDTELRAQLKELGIRYPVARINYKLQTEYFADSLPTTYLLNAHGLVQKKIVGLHSLAQMQKIVREAAYP